MTLVIETLEEARYPSEQGGEEEDCEKCVRGKKNPCKKRLTVKCKEMIVVYKTLPLTGQKIYWFLKNASRNGKRRVLIKDKLFAAAIDCEYKSFYYGCDFNRSHGYIEVEKIKWEQKSYPRKLYTFVGVDRDVFKRFDFPG